MRAVDELAVRWLDDVEAADAQVGYGSLGRHGSLEYEGAHVLVEGSTYEHALSTHGPARVVFRLDGTATAFHTNVAINDDVLGQTAHAHFLVRADGRLVAQAAYVLPGEAPRPLSADVRGASTLELLVLTTRFEYCHAVWLDPLLDDRTAEPPATRACALARTEITLPNPLPRARRCIATTVSPGFSAHLDDLLGSVVANARCGEALLAVFAVDPDDDCRRVADRYGAVLVPCAPRAPVNSTVKAVLYTAAHAIDADQFVCLDADMLVLEDLRPLFGALSAHSTGAVLACREGNGSWYANLMQALTTVYGGRPSDIERICGTAGDGSCSLVVNDGTFAAGRAALLTLDGEIRRWTGAPGWVDERRHIYWRNQFVFNLALAKLDCGVEIDPAFNIQLNNQDVAIGWRDGRVAAHWQGSQARILHFNGLGRHKYPEWRGWYTGAEPMVGPGADDGFDAFECALRSWVGRYGLGALAWSFYGTRDATAALVRDPVALPLFRAVHDLVRANGCVRVVETGTARGVSAALLAAAVAHHPGARVVTFDPVVFPERDELWAALGPERRAVIDAREVDAIAGLRAALAAGERYEVALLDSVHTEEHVWLEFELVTQLVCPGGLILVHDPELPGGSVAGALQRAARAGYGVTRLWTAEAGVAQDDGLGMAVIENRRARGRT